jgi:hypothetical protein
VAVVGAKIAAVPGAAEQRRELAVPLAEHMEHGGELLREQEETAIGGRLLIAQSMDDAAGCGAGGGDAVRGPETVGFGEEAGELAPACSFAGLARFADQYDEEIEAVTGGAHEAMRRMAGEVAEGGQELQEDGSGIGFGVRREGTDGEAGKAVESRLGQCGRSGRSGFLGKTVVFFKGGLLPIEGFAGRRGGWRRPLPGLEGE